MTTFCLVSDVYYPVIFNCRQSKMDYMGFDFIHLANMRVPGTLNEFFLRWENKMRVLFPLIQDAQYR